MIRLDLTPAPAHQKKVQKRVFYKMDNVLNPLRLSKLSCLFLICPVASWVNSKHESTFEDLKGISIIPLIKVSVKTLDFEVSSLGLTL